MKKQSIVNNKFAEPVLIFGAAITCWLLASYLNLFEALHLVVSDLEIYQFDEFVLLVFLLGTAGHFYAYRSESRKRYEIKRRISAEEELEWLSKHDSLTGLPNRRYLKEILDQQNAFGRTQGEHGFGVLSIDLDGFKKANDLLGHAGGDAVLVEVSKRLRAFENIKYAFRLGGDEFVALVDRAEGHDLMKVARDLQAALIEPVVTDGVVHVIGASIGVAYYPEDDHDLNNVIHYADLAMYAIKRQKEQAVVRFTPEMIAANQERAKMEKDLLQALELGEIRPHYQPLIELGSQQIYGFEALARWNRPGYGYVSPEEFVRVAEDMGVITQLSDNLLKMACTDALKWPQDMMLSFNLSPVQLADPMLGLRIIKILKQVGFPPKRLELEITESAIVQDVERAVVIIGQLRSIGVSLSLDDFGTGYSNLSQLSNLEFDRLKVDQSFIQNFKNDEKQLAIVSAILSLSRSLGVQTTAEGIEDDEQLAALQELGCGCGQGYLLGRPIDAASTLDLIAEHRSEADLVAS